MSTTYGNADTSSLADGLDRTMSAGADTARSAAKTISSTAKDVSEKAVAARDAVSQFVEERPLTAVAIAIALGVLLSRSLSGR